jgi:hypothetical protein
MDICQVETGLLKKKPCGQPGVTHCLNCEQALCAKHAVPQLKESGQKTGKFLCKECFAAQKEAAKIMPASPPPAPAKKADAPPPAPKPAAPAPAAAKTATPAPAKPEPKKPDMDDSGPLEFTPTKK